MAKAPRRLVKAPRLVGAVYRRILDGLLDRGFKAPRERVRVGKPMLIWILLRHGIFSTSTSSTPRNCAVSSISVLPIRAAAAIGRLAARHWR